MIGCSVKKQGTRKGRPTLRKDPHSAADEIAKYISTCKSGHFCPVIHLASDHSFVTLRVIVVENRQCEARRRATRRRHKAVRPFHNVPAKICAGLVRGETVDLFKFVLSNVANPKVSGHGIKRKAERISQAINPYLRAASAGHKRVGWWNRVVQSRRMRGVDVNAQHLPEECIGVLTVTQRVATAAAIPEADVKKAVFAKREAAALVVGKWLIHGEENVFHCRVSEVCVGGRGRELRNDRLQLGSAVARVIHVETSVACIVRMKSKPEQASFSSGSESGPPGYVHKRRRRTRPVALNDLDVPALLNNEEPAAVVIGLLDIKGIGKTGRDLYERAKNWLKYERTTQITPTRHNPSAAGLIILSDSCGERRVACFALHPER